MRLPASAAPLRRLPLVLAALLVPAMAIAETTFPQPIEFSGRFRAAGDNPAAPVLAGGKISIHGSGLVPGQRVTLQRGTAVLSGESPLIADDKGAVRLDLELPADAAPGLHPVVALLEGPSMTTTFDVKISVDVPQSGADLFAVQAAKSAPGLYQSAYGASSGGLFVTAANFRPVSSVLLKLDPDSLAVLAEATPPEVPPEHRLRFGLAPGEEPGPQPFAVFGLGVDDVKGTVWVTNTAHNTVAVYNQSDLSLVKQFPAGEVYHSRDVIVDGARGRAYVSASATNGVHVFDTATLEKLAVIEIASGKRGGEFSLMSLALDTAGGRLFAVSRLSNELAVIDLGDNSVTQVIALPGAKNASGVAYDPDNGRVLVASQDSDNLLILDLASGAVLHDVTTGAGALNVVIDPVSKLAFVPNRVAGTVTVVSGDGKIVANLDNGTYANHVHADGKGNVFAVNKSAGPDDARGDLVTRYRLK